MSDTQAVSLLQLLTSSKAWQFYLFVGLLILFFSFLASRRIFSIQTKLFQLGKSTEDLERFIISKQLEYGHQACTSMYTKILRMGDDLNTWHIRCVLEYCYDEIVNWISFNHLTLDEDYVDSKASSLRALVRSNVERDVFFTDEFNQVVDSFTKEVLTELIRIRRTIKKGGRCADL